MVVTGFPWWSEQGADGERKQITLLFDGISEGTFPLPVDGSFFENLEDTTSEDLEHFSVKSLATVDWAQPPLNEIYCHMPLPDAAGIYSRLQSFLITANAFKGPKDFLNQGHLLEAFTKVTSSHSYLLARATDDIGRILCTELDRQNVAYNVLVKAFPRETRLWVRFNDSSFLCREAWAESTNKDII